ncbi:MAG: hypothetical protein M0R28_05935 [Pigmentiphaga sp.]|nr:hypothetical protein [Pigmentiphaga sp.]
MHESLCDRLVLQVGLNAAQNCLVNDMSANSLAFTQSVHGHIASVVPVPAPHGAVFSEEQASQQVVVAAFARALLALISKTGQDRFGFIF